MMSLTNVTLLITNCVRPGLCNVYWIPIHTRIKPEEACCSSDAQESPSYSEVQFFRASPDVSFFKHSELLVRSYFMTPKKKKKKKNLIWIKWSWKYIFFWNISPEWIELISFVDINMWEAGVSTEGTQYSVGSTSFYSCWWYESDDVLSERQANSDT